jgi:hypothetical protein
VGFLGGTKNASQQDQENDNGCFAGNPAACAYRLAGAKLQF